jgi:hypothetical protein
MPMQLGRKPGSTCRESKNGTRALVRLARRGVKACSSEVLAELLDDASPAVQMAAAREILKRRYGAPPAPVDAVIEDGARDLEMLRELAERGLRSDQAIARQSG